MTSGANEGLTIHVERCTNCSAHSHFTRHKVFAPVRFHCAPDCTARPEVFGRACQEEKYASMFEVIKREFGLAFPGVMVLFNPGPGDA